MGVEPSVLGVRLVHGREPAECGGLNYCVGVAGCRQRARRFFGNRPRPSSMLRQMLVPSATNRRSSGGRHWLAPAEVAQSEKKRGHAPQREDEKKRQDANDAGAVDHDRA